MKNKKNNSKIQAVLLAAGESSRFWPLNQYHKSFTKMLGKPLIYWTIKTLTGCGIKDIIVICNSVSRPILEKELDVKELKCEISYVLQEKPAGTGDAVFRAKKLIDSPFLLIHPFKFYIKDIINKILDKKNKTDAQIILVSSPTNRPQDYGMLKFENDKAIEICENPPPGKEPSNFKTTGIYFLTPEFFRFYEKFSHHREEDLIDVFNLMIKEKDCRVIFLEKEPPTLKYPWHLFEIIKKIFESGYFKNHISPTAKIAKNVVINGHVFIGKNVKIGENTVINGPCFIGDDCQIGMNNVFRGHVNLEKEVKTGAFTEIKNSIIQEETHIHSGYFGDTIIGKNCRFGAGFITANRRIDRKTIKTTVKGKKMDTYLTYFGAVVGNNSRFGIHCSVMPGVLIGSNSQIGPNSTVEKNIKDNIAFYAKFENIVKEIKK